MKNDILNNTITIPDIFDKILSMISYAINWSGAAILNILQSVFPEAVFPENLADLLGYLVVLTVLVLLIQTLRRIVWMLVVAGWLLILMRIISIVFHGE